MGGMRDGWEGGPKGDMCMYIADSLHCTVVTNTPLHSNYNTI